MAEARADLAVAAVRSRSRLVRERDCERSEDEVGRDEDESEDGADAIETSRASEVVSAQSEVSTPSGKRERA